MLNVVLYEANDNYFYFINTLEESKHKIIMEKIRVEKWEDGIGRNGG